VSCAICETRKEKRFCLALHGRICRQCCAEQREVTLDCPSECVYLQQAREHEKPSAEEFAEKVKDADLFAKVDLSGDFVDEHRELIVAFSYAVAKCARADRSVYDRDLIAALTSLSKRYETRINSGLHYESPITSLAQQAISAEVQNMLMEFRQAEQKHFGYARLRDTDVLRALVFLLRMAYRKSMGRAKSRAFIDFLLAQFPVNESAILAPDQVGSRLVMP